MTETERIIGDVLQTVVLPLNPAAAFEKAGAARNLLPASPETDVMVEGVTYRAQVYRDTDRRDIQHIVYAPVGQWDQVAWFERPNTPLPEPVADYYVSLDGSDANDGRTPQTAWKTIGKAASAMPAGKAVLVYAGDYPERVRVTRPGAYLANGAVTCRGFTVKADNVAIRDFAIADTPDHDTDGWGIRLTGNRATIYNCYVHGATRGGIRIDPPSQDCVVVDCLCEGCSQVGIEIHGLGNVVETCEVWGTVQHHPKSSETRWLDADGVHYFGRGHVFRGNYIHDITFDQPENVDPHIDAFQTWSGDAWHEAARDIVFEGNYIDLLVAQSEAERGVGWMLRDTEGITIRNNVVRATQIIDTYNRPNKALTVVHNTFVSDLAAPLTGGVCIIDCPNSTVRDNIFYNFPSNYIGMLRVEGDTTGNVAGPNLYYRSDGGALTAPVRPGDVRGEDPLFVDPAGDDYRLQPGSPAIGAASDGGDMGAGF